MDISTLIFALFISLAFAGVWWGLTRLGANLFLIAFLSALAACAVFFSHSFFGIKL
jgi:hypothetical protein